MISCPPYRLLSILLFWKARRQCTFWVSKSVISHLVASINPHVILNQKKDFELHTDCEVAKFATFPVANMVFILQNPIQLTVVKVVRLSKMPGFWLNGDQSMETLSFDLPSPFRFFSSSLNGHLPFAESTLAIWFISRISRLFTGFQIEIGLNIKIFESC